jgi:hypothetical protein
MRDIETIKSELRLLAAVRRTPAEVAAPATARRCRISRSRPVATGPQAYANSGLVEGHKIVLRVVRWRPGSGC